MKLWRRIGRKKAAELREERELQNIYKPRKTAQPASVTLDPQRAQKLKVARICMALLGSAFVALGVHLTMHAELLFSPFVLAIGGSAVYGAFKTPDHLLIRWLKGLFLAI